MIVEKKTEEDRFNWRPPLYAAIGAFLIFLPISLYSSQWGGFLYVFALAPAISLGLFVIGIVLAARWKPRQALAVVAALLAFWAVSWFLLRNELPIRSEVRWLFRSRTYKAQVLSQPLPANGELRSIEWDGWGLPGAGDTVVYLVFAPDDSLESPKNHAPGKFTGLPCEVDEIHRLEKDWYTVLFYTDTDSGHCR